MPSQSVAIGKLQPQLIAIMKGDRRHLDAFTIFWLTPTHVRNFCLKLAKSLLWQTTPHLKK